MTAVEVVLIVIGLIFVLGSFFLKEKLSEKDIAEMSKMSEKELKIIVDKQLKSANTQIEDYVDEAIDATSDKTKRELEKMTNEKIMAISEYSDTVLESINKSHEEIMFLYSMLNDKHSELTNLASELQRFSDHMRTTENEVLERLSEAALEVSEKVKAQEAEPIVTEEEAMQEAVYENDRKNSAGQSEATSSESNHNIRILELHKQGKTNVEIAKELGLGLGEVKLVLGLFRGGDEDAV